MALAFNSYKTLLTAARQGINLTELELSNLDRIVYPLIKKGQSISNIYKTNDLPCTRATLYNYVAKNCFSARNIDLPRRVKMKKRKQKRGEQKDTATRTNRTYEDFKNYIELHPDLPIIEMDTVEGIKGGRVLLTFLFRPSKLMLAFILYEKTFPIILTANGTEFGDPLSLEFNEAGIGRTRLFYCNPRASYQKGML